MNIGLEFSDDELENIFADCELYSRIKSLFTVYTSKTFSNLEPGETKEILLIYAKTYLKKKKESDLAKLTLEDLKDNETKKDFLEFSAIELGNIYGTDMLISEAHDLLRNPVTFSKTMKKYITHLKAFEEKNNSLETIISEFEEDGIPAEQYNPYIERIKKKRQTLDSLLEVSNSEATKFIKGQNLAQILAERFVFNPDGTKKITNSLVEDKLITIYMRIGEHDKASELAKEKMQYDEKTGKVADGSERTASKYVKILRNQGKYFEAMNFIDVNKKQFSKDSAIMHQYFNLFDVLPDRKMARRGKIAIALNSEKIIMNPENQKDYEFLKLLIFTLELARSTEKDFKKKLEYNKTLEKLGVREKRMHTSKRRARSFDDESL